jgi:murein DD-endopeptidase MepM/ murein hydrolase activator NlpD
VKWARHPRTRFLLASVGIVVAVATLVARLTRVSRNRRPEGRPELATLTKPSPTPSEGITLPAPVHAISPAIITTPTPTPSPAIESVTPSPNNNLLQTPGPVNLIVPVAGVRPDQLRDTFSDARSEGRVHDAIDIAAPLDTPVLAAADGTIVKLFHSDRGGTTIYQLSSDSKFFYYYAHLARYADGLAEGQVVKQGQTVGYVGDSGNAGAGNYHLHFSISIVSDPKRYWEGVNINPYPLLRR